MVDIKVRRNRSKVKISYDTPVVVASRSNKNTTLVLLEPVSKKVITSVSSASVKTAGTKSEKAFEVGKMMAKVLVKNKYPKVVFDRNGYPFMGRLAKLVEGLKSEGIQI